MAASDFPANNAAEFQTVDVLLTGTPQDISSLFDFTDVPVYDLPVPEDQLPLGFVVGIVDPTDRGIPKGPVSAPIYLQFASDLNTPPIARDDAFATAADTILVGEVFADNGNGPDFDPDLGDTIAVSAINGGADVGVEVTLPSGATVVVGADGSFTYDPDGAFEDLAAGASVADQFQYTITDGEAHASATVTISVTGAGEVDGGRLLIVDDGADQVFEYDEEGAALTSRSLDGDNSVSRGLAASADGSRYWVVDNSRHVYVYGADGVLLSDWEFTGLSVPEGIAVSGSDVWIVSRLTDEVYFFAGGADFTGGTHAPTSSFALDAGNDAPYGITTDGASLWVVNDAANAWKVFKYTVAGQLEGSWDLDAGNRNARGIAFDPESPDDLLVINSGSADSIFRYEDARDVTAGSQTADETIALPAANSSPSGIAGLAAPTIESADFDDDGDVDGTDFLIWQRGFGIASGATPSAGDANGDQAVDEADLTVWSSQFATTSGPIGYIAAVAGQDDVLQLDGGVTLTLSGAEPAAEDDQPVEPTDVAWERFAADGDRLESQASADRSEDEFESGFASENGPTGVREELDWLTDELLRILLA